MTDAFSHPLLLAKEVYVLLLIFAIRRSRLGSHVFYQEFFKFQGSLEGNPVVQVALIAESSRLQMMLSTYGISTQTPLELEPIQIWPSWKLVKVSF